MTKTGLAGTAALAFLLAVSGASAQSYFKVGELLDKGATRVEAADLKSLLTGATASGRLLSNLSRDFEITYSKDGTVQGSVAGYGDQPRIGFKGTWMVDDKGMVCTEIGSTKSCTMYYRYQNSYFQAASTDRDAVIASREIKR